MPKPAHNGINWGELKAAAIALGSVNEAAKRAGSTLPPDEAERFRERVNKRAYRERWLDTANTLALSSPSNAKPLSQSVQTGSIVLKRSLSDLGRATRMQLAKATHKGAKSLKGMSGSLIVKEAGNLKSLVGAASQLHGWESEQGQVGCLSVDVLTTEGAIRVRTGPAVAQD